MIEHVWSVLCGRSVIDSATNNVSLIDALEEISLGGLSRVDVEKALAEGQGIVVPVTAELVTLWSRGADDSPERGHGRVMLEQPSGKTLRGPDYDIDLSTHKRLRSRSQNAGLPYVGPGRYIFHVQFRPHGGDEDWRDVAKVPLWVRVEYDSIIEEMAPPGGEYLQAAHSTGTIREA